MDYFVYFESRLKLVMILLEIIIMLPFVLLREYIYKGLNQQNVTKYGRKEMFYLTTHSTHFIFQLYGIIHMVKDHLDSERGNLLSPLHGLLFPISSKGSFICTIPQTG